MKFLLKTAISKYKAKTLIKLLILLEELDHSFVCGGPCLSLMLQSMQVKDRKYRGRMVLLLLKRIGRVFCKRAF